MAFWLQLAKSVIATKPWHCAGAFFVVQPVTFETTKRFDGTVMQNILYIKQIHSILPVTTNQIV